MDRAMPDLVDKTRECRITDVTNSLILPILKYGMNGPAHRWHGWCCKHVKHVLNPWVADGHVSGSVLVRMRALHTTAPASGMSKVCMQGEAICMHDLLSSTASGACICARVTIMY